MLNEEKRRRAEDAGGRVRENFFLLSGYVCVMWVWVMWLFSKDEEKLVFQVAELSAEPYPQLSSPSLSFLLLTVVVDSPWARFLALFLFSFPSLIFDELCDNLSRISQLSLQRVEANLITYHLTSDNQIDFSILLISHVCFAQSPSRRHTPNPTWISALFMRLRWCKKNINFTKTAWG